MVAYFERSCLIITFNLVLLTPYILDILQKKTQSQGDGLEHSNTVTGRRDVNYLQPGAKKIITDLLCLFLQTI